MKLESISEKIIEQNEEIYLFRDDDILGVAQMIMCEASELLEATENAFLTDDLTAITSEAADCFYLLIRLFDLIGIDERAVEIKIKRNMLKYAGFDNKEKAIEEWEAMGGDKRFYDEIDKFIK